ncbi:MAG: type II toxin-antitoxin system VapC family toxin, partial [Planctomycetota bacterium]
LVDTSVWIAHFRAGDSRLKSLLEEGQVVCHEFIIGEIACGNLRNRKEILSLLDDLPRAETAEPQEVLEFIDNHRLHGKGLGDIDMHLLASAILTEVPLWTLDNKLRQVAAKFKVDYVG